MKNEVLIPVANNASKTRVINSTVKTNQPVQVNTDDLFLGFINNAGNTPPKDQAEEWNMSLSLTMNLHMVISEAMKSKKERNESKMLTGLQMAIDQTDLIYKTFAKTKLVNDFNEKDNSLRLGYVGLDMDTSFNDLSEERKAKMLGIAKQFKMMITEVIQPNTNRSIDKIVALLKYAVYLANAFYTKNNEVLLFHQLHPIR